MPSNQYLQQSAEKVEKTDSAIKVAGVAAGVLGIAGAPWLAAGAAAYGIFKLGTRVGQLEKHQQLKVDVNVAEGHVGNYYPGFFAMPSSEKASQQANEMLSDAKAATKQGVAIVKPYLPKP